MGDRQMSSDNMVRQSYDGEPWGGWELSTGTLSCGEGVKEISEEVTKKPSPNDTQESAWHFVGRGEKRPDLRWENKSELDRHW